MFTHMLFTVLHKVIHTPKPQHIDKILDYLTIKTQYVVFASKLSTQQQQTTTLYKYILLYLLCPNKAK